MTYLELLNRIKNGNQPEMILFKDEMYVWYETDYLNYNSDNYLRNRLSETEMVSKNCIFEIRIVEHEVEK